MNWLLFYFCFTISCLGGSIPLNRQAQFYSTPAKGVPPVPPAGTYTFLGATNADIALSAPATVTFNPVGAQLIVISCCNYQSLGTDSGPSDGVNTYLSGNINGGKAGQITNQLFYCTNVVSSGAITVSCVRFYTVLAISWYSYSGTTPTFDGQSTGFSSPTGAGSATFPTGTATPSGASALAVTGIAWGGGAGVTGSIDSSFNIRKAQQQVPNNMWGGIADLTISGSVSPTWTITSSGDGGCNIMWFK